MTSSAGKAREKRGNSADALLDSPIALQKRADDVRDRLRKEGDHEAADTILALRMWGYDREMRLSAVLTAARGAFPMESER